MLNDIGRFRELPRWRRDFKSEWKKAMRTPIIMPLNKKYQPDIKHFICTCPHFVVSRFLLCKHLVRQFKPVNPKFFLEVTRNRCIPFWSHPSLKPLSSTVEGWPVHPEVPEIDGDNDVCMERYNRRNMVKNEVVDSNLEPEGEDDGDDDGDDALVDTWEDGDNVERKTCKEAMENNVQLIREFCDGLDYQLQFQDPRFLRTLEKEGGRFLKLARDCLRHERRYNSSQTASPTTWEGSTANTLFYRSCPRRDQQT